MPRSAADTIAYELIIGNFAARTDAYVLDSTEHIEHPLTADVLAKAYAKGHAISAYTALIEEGQPTMTQVGAIDLDEGTLEEDGKAVRKVLWDHDIPSLLVGSRRGFHLWTFHTGNGQHGSVHGGMVPARDVRDALFAAAGLAGLPGHKPTVKAASGPDCAQCGVAVHRHPEVFPKPSGKPWGVGALRLPLMKHPKTGLVYKALDMDGFNLPTVFNLLDAVATMTAPYEKVWALAGGEHRSMDYPSYADIGEHRRVRPTQGDDVRVTTLLNSIGVEGTPGHSIRCPFHEDGKASLSIAQDDQRAWCKSPTCDLYNDGRGIGSLGLRRYLRDRGVKE